MVVAMKEVGALKPTNSYQAALSAKSGSSASHKSLSALTVWWWVGGGESAHWGIVAYQTSAIGAWYHVQCVCMCFETSEPGNHDCWVQPTRRICACFKERFCSCSKSHIRWWTTFRGIAKFHAKLPRTLQAFSQTWSKIHHQKRLHGASYLQIPLKEVTSPLLNIDGNVSGTNQESSNLLEAILIHHSSGHSTTP